MALKATIYKAELSVADMDRHYYETHNLTIAKHPSETDERMMVRILAFALNAHEQLQFTKGISTEGEPDLWQKSLSDENNLWIALGLPSEKNVRQFCNKAQKTIVYCYGGNPADAWWARMEGKTKRFTNLKVINLAQKETKALAKLANRTMQLQVSIQDGEVMINSEDEVHHIVPIEWKEITN